MNINEVLANRGLELMGKKKAEYKFLDPHDHLNQSQSTNDSYPTAMHIGMAFGNRELIAEYKKLIESFNKKSQEFSQLLKMGRTQLQDAVPMTLGQEFRAFAKTLQDEVNALERVENVLCEVSMGGTAIGTGLNAPKGYAEKCTQHLAKITGMPMKLSEDLIEATQDTQAFVLYSSVLKSLAIKLAKVGNDLRLLSSGPRTGLREINLPATQPGSSIMPGKVNPVIPEVTNMVAYRVIGNDLVVTLSAEGGQLQLNAFEPVIAAVIFEGQTLLINAAADAAHVLHRRDHRQRGRPQALCRVQHRDGDRAQPGHRLRQGHRACRRGAEERRGHPGAGSREAHPDGRTGQRDPQPGGPDGPGALGMHDTRG
jgi:aspartate ammonia-lyase